jgi:hypothetical protein
LASGPSAASALLGSGTAAGLMAGSAILGAGAFGFWAGNDIDEHLHLSDKISDATSGR